MAELKRGNRDRAPPRPRKKPCTSPLPSLALVTYFSRTPCQTKTHIEQLSPGSVIMVNHNSVISSPQSTELKQSSHSSIPRPSSGTSKVSITSQLPKKSCMRVRPMALANERQNAVQRRPYVVQDEHSMQGYHLPRSLLPSSESLLGCLPNMNDQDEAYEKRRSVKSLTLSSLGSSLGGIHTEETTRKSCSSLPRFATQADLVYSRERSSPKSQPKSGLGFKLYPAYQTRPRALVPDNHPSLSGSVCSVVSSKGLRSGTAGQQLQKLEATEGVLDSRFVHVFETVEYWLGRYVACHDRLRNADHESILNAFKGNQRSTPDVSKISPGPNPSDADLRYQVLAELRAFCRTEAATSGFDQFEYYLYHPNSTARTTQQRRQWSGTKSFGYNSNKVSNHYPMLNATQHKPRKISRSFSSSIFEKPHASVTDRSNDLQVIPDSFGIALPKRTVPLDVSHSGPGKSHHRTLSWRSVDLARQLPPHKDAIPISAAADCQTSHGSSRTHFASIYVSKEQGRQEGTCESPQNIDDFKKPLKRSGLVQSESLPSMVSGLSDSSQTSYASFHTTALRQAPQQDYIQSATTRGARRFRQSESMKRIVDAGIREIKKIGHRVSHQSGHDSSDEE